MDCDRYLLGVKSHRLLPRARDGASYRQTFELPVTFLQILDFLK